MIQSIDHISLGVKNVKVSRSFYEKLGFVPIERPNFDFNGAWFSIGDRHELHLIQVDKDIVGGGSRSTHYALRVEDVYAFYEHLKELGVVSRAPKARPDGRVQLFFEDPDGHVWECN